MTGTDEKVMRLFLPFCLYCDPFTGLFDSRFVTDICKQLADQANEKVMRLIRVKVGEGKVGEGLCCGSQPTIALFAGRLGLGR